MGRFVASNPPLFILPPCNRMTMATTAIQIMDVETGKLLVRLWDARSGPLYSKPNVAFNATDDLVVTDGALWDASRGVSVGVVEKLGGGGDICWGIFLPLCI